MATIFAALGGLSGTLATAGSVVGAVGTVFSGIHEKAKAKFEARQMKAKGDAEFAISQPRN